MNSFVLPFARNCNWAARCLSAVIGVVGLASCEAASERAGLTPRTTVHPIISDEANSSYAEITSSTSVAANSRVGRLRDALRQATRGLALGTLGLPSETAFGNPIDIAIGPSGNVHVLDAMNNDIRVFDDSGTYLYSIGRAGSGPVEMRYPVGLEFSSQGDMILVESSGIKLIEKSDAGFRQKSTIPVGRIPSPTAACVGGGIIYQRSASRVQKGIVTAVTEDGTRTASFGEGYRHGGTIAQEDLSIGPIACTTNGGGVAAAFTHLPLIRMYDDAGQLQWTSRISDFEPRRFEETTTRDGRTTFRHVASVGDIVLTLHAGPDSTLIVQVASLGEPDQKRRQPILRRRTFAVDVLSGHGVFVGDQLPRLLAVGRDWMWAVQEDTLGFLKVVRFSFSAEES